MPEQQPPSPAKNPTLVLPKPGQTTSQRRKELDEASFIVSRNLVHRHYKDAAGNPLMNFQQTLDDRELVKTTIVNHEASIGALVEDGGGRQPTTPLHLVQPVEQPVAPQGEVMPVPPQQLPMPFPQPQQPQPSVPMMPQPMQGPPQPMPPPYQPPMPPQQPYPPQAIPAPANPAEAAAAPVTGKKRRPASGVAVAPPPAAIAPPVYQQPPQAVAQQPMPYQPPQPPMPMPYQPPMQQTPPVQHPPTQGGSLDMVIQKLDDLGKGLEIAAGNGNDAAKATKALAGEVADLRNSLNLVLATLHHMYLVTPATMNIAQGKNIAGFTEFKAFIQSYVGNPK